jgi:hypothetical protein
VIDAYLGGGPSTNGDSAPTPEATEGAPG